MIGVVCIVKDEIERIDAFLDNVQSVCDGPLTLVDTGSTDTTVERIEARGITVHHVPFVNFGQARSEAFRLARGTADWIAALDCDMSIEIDPDFEPNPLVDCYMLALGSADFSYRLPLLLRGDLDWRSVGAVHEYSSLPDRVYTSLPTDQVRITITGPDRSSREKSLWHVQLLEAELAEQPDNARTQFYLAQTYADLGDPRAIAAYDRRIRMGGWDEETFYSMYRRATLLPTWPARMLAFIEAWEFRPSRYEPVYELAKGLNYGGKHQAALRFASIPVVPSTDNLFVHRGVERWGIPFELSIATWWAGDRARSYEMMDELLAMPDLPAHIREATERNRGFASAA